MKSENVCVRLCAVLKTSSPPSAHKTCTKTTKNERIPPDGAVFQMRPMCPDEPSIALSILSIKFTRPDGNSEVREVRHYQWLDWPDRGVPPCRLTSMVRNHRHGYLNIRHYAETILHVLCPRDS